MNGHAAPIVVREVETNFLMPPSAIGQDQRIANRQLDAAALAMKPRESDRFEPIPPAEIQDD